MTANNPTGLEQYTITADVDIMSGGSKTISAGSTADYFITTTDGVNWQQSQQSQWTGEAPVDLGKYQQLDNYYWPKVYPSVYPDMVEQVNELIQSNLDRNKKQKQKQKNSQKKGEFYIMKRLVQIVVVDPDHRVKDELSLVHMGTVQLTSLSDEDLLLEVDLKSALKKHNETRAVIVDEDRSDKRHSEVFLKPAKVSELEKRIVVIQKF